jgi:hypothetical protein
MASHVTQNPSSYQAPLMVCLPSYLPESVPQLWNHLVSFHEEIRKGMGEKPQTICDRERNCLFRRCVIGIHLVIKYLFAFDQSSQFNHDNVGTNLSFYIVVCKIGSKIGIVTKAIFARH